MAINDYMRSRQEHIHNGRPLPEKKITRIKPISDKRAAKIAQQKQEFKKSGESETELERWFQRRRAEMVGTCQCGCGERSSKWDDKNFRSSICHIFPQRLFPSIRIHHLNWVERKHWATSTQSACHTNMDNKSMDLWPMFSDWDDIKEKFHILAAELTDQEKAKKFFKNLLYLVERN